VGGDWDTWGWIIEEGEYVFATTELAKWTLHRLTQGARGWNIRLDTRSEGLED